jgi:hypothetical protein
LQVHVDFEPAIERRRLAPLDAISRSSENLKLDEGEFSDRGCNNGWTLAVIQEPISMNSYLSLFEPTNQMEIDIVCDIVAARWRLRRIWCYQTAMLDVEMDKQAPDFEKRYATYDEYMRGAAAFSAIVDHSKGYVTALRTDIHLTRIYRRAVDDLRRLRRGNLLNENRIFQNEPENQDLSPLNTTEAAPEISTEPKEPETT